MAGINVTLTGRVAAVTGGSRGIGLAIAARLARAGAEVFIGGRDEPALQSACDQLNRDAARRVVHGLRLNVAEESGVGGFFQELESRTGRLDVLVVNAGVNPHRGRQMPDIEVSDWDHTIATNLRGAFLCCRAALPLLQSRDAAKMIFINSIAGRINPDAVNPAYRASKFALRSLAISVAASLVDTGVSVSSIFPGTTRTAMVGDSAKPGKALEPEDIAEVVQFLVSLDPNIIIPEVAVSPRAEISGPLSPYL